jgi:hypothetical protein
MSYQGFGMAFPIKTPVGTYNVDIPVDQMMQAAVAAGWPIMQQNLQAELPKVMAQVQDAAINKMWPAFQPKIDAMAKKFQADALKSLAPQIKSVKTQAALGWFTIIAAIGAAAWWVKKG